MGASRGHYIQNLCKDTFGEFAHALGTAHNHAKREIELSQGEMKDSHRQPRPDPAVPSPACGGRCPEGGRGRFEPRASRI